VTVSEQSGSRRNDTAHDHPQAAEHTDHAGQKRGPTFGSPHPPKAERAGETGDAGSFIPVNNSIESDHGRLKSRLRPMRGLKQFRSVKVSSAGHAFVQNLRRGHYELGSDLDSRHRLRAAFAELTLAI